MFEAYEFSGRVPRIRANRLALCLSAVLVSQVSGELALATSPAATPPHSAADLRAPPAKHNPNHPSASPWMVKNCTDHDIDSLRDIIQNRAQSGDVVDLSNLPTLCNTKDSKITLTNGEIGISQNDLTLRGPSADGSVTISGGGMSRVLDHLGSGTLTLDRVTIAEGNYHTSGFAGGGCIRSVNGSVSLLAAVVTGCTIMSDTDYSGGGGIFAKQDVTLVLSIVSGNQSLAPTRVASSGGILAQHTLSAKYSTISTNISVGGAGSSAGGAYAGYEMNIFASTVDHNTARNSSALLTKAGSISDTTISDNTADGICSLFIIGGSFSISNSTIAFNHTNLDTPPGAVCFSGPANGALTLQSSIIADNTAGPANMPADIYMYPGFGSLAGADNVVVASNVSDPAVITVTTDPKLGPLQFNGGLTRTRALLPGSPALAMGNNTAMRPNDQRGLGYPRTTGPTQTVDIGALQFDTIFVSGLDGS